jgi:hypothetical protein
MQQYTVDLNTWELTTHYYIPHKPDFVMGIEFLLQDVDVFVRIFVN